MNQWVGHRGLETMNYNGGIYMLRRVLGIQQTSSHFYAKTIIQITRATRKSRKTRGGRDHEHLRESVNEHVGI